MVNDSDNNGNSSFPIPLSNPKLTPSVNNHLTLPIDESDNTTSRIKEQYSQIVTNILNDNDKKIEKMTDLVEDSSYILVCSSLEKEHFVNSNFFKIIKTISTKSRNRQHSGIRWITTVKDKCDGNIIRLCLSYGIRIRHIDTIPSSFVISEKEALSSVSGIEDICVSKSIIYSNDQLHVKNFNSLFNKLWETGIDAEQKIESIEKGVEYADVEIISNPEESLKQVWKVIKEAKKEVSILFSTANAVLRQVRMGGLDFLKEIVFENENKNKNVEINMLIPFNKQIEDVIIGVKNAFPKIKIRTLTPEVQTNISMVLVDQKECLTLEVNDDAKNDSCYAVGTSIHYKNKSIVSCYDALFKSFWKQAILYEQLKEAHEKLKIHDKMQNEFTNVVAHELRTPIQPILGLTQLIKDQIKEDGDEKQKEIFDVIIRNSKRLQLLIGSILDVTKIEGNIFSLYKQKFSISELVVSIIQDYKNNLDNGKRIEFEYNDIDVEIYADRNRLCQVISNLISNSVKFIPNVGKIIISVEKEIDNGVDSKENEIVVVSVKDTGIGIDKEILPKLFEKFVSKSFQGTGLGLFISKKIVEAHGGRIWAENNENGKGATFIFSLPIEKEIIAPANG
ncbi:MAG: HAMP domain-containing histidine kinase [Thermoproteota archaeon]|nr:HAMP domain-containing histidine kinase [Thermoproteota archaeon]